MDQKIVNILNNHKEEIEEIKTRLNKQDKYINSIIRTLDETCSIIETLYKVCVED